MSRSKNSVILEKDKYSESVIRKSLYWLSENCKWHLNEKENIWEIVIQNDDKLNDYICSLHRHLNDFLLREALDKESGNMRRKIISVSLRKMCES